MKTRVKTYVKTRTLIGASVLLLASGSGIALAGSDITAPAPASQERQQRHERSGQHGQRGASTRADASRHADARSMRERGHAPRHHDHVRADDDGHHHRMRMAQAAAEPMAGTPWPDGGRGDAGPRGPAR
ncbi:MULTISPECIES: hypothetical protein [unclassified Xanthobacter]|uniref:hypothetical protein n=1 Tax=unclassified Xanthobacter TaxID=2623496 RepID=UPI001F15C7AE|nr:MULTISPECIES: hypothetical protein [unclassified Xanthobacter]